MRALMSVRLACRLGDWRQLRMWVHDVSTAYTNTVYAQDTWYVSREQWQWSNILVVFVMSLYAIIVRLFVQCPQLKVWSTDVYVAEPWLWVNYTSVCAVLMLQNLNHCLQQLQLEILLMFSEWPLVTQILWKISRNFPQQKHICSFFLHLTILYSDI